MVIASASLFLDFQLPNATTWFYFSWLLGIALFFKFSRVLSVRNLDIILLFLLTPGILLVQASQIHPRDPHDPGALAAAAMVAQIQPGGLTPFAAQAPVEVHRQQVQDIAHWQWIGYLWLLCGTALFFLRCLWDLSLVQRPALAPNLSPGGLGWLALTLLACLIAVAFRQQMRLETAPSQSSAPPALSSKDMVGPNAPLVGKEGALLHVARTFPAWMVSSFAMLCHLAVILGLLIIGRRHFQNVEAGIAAATCYLLLPYTGFFVSQVHHVWPVTLLVGAFVFYPRPRVAGLLLGVAAGTAYFPAFLLPVWLSFYGKKGAGRFLLMFLLGLSLSLGALLLIHLQKDDLNALWTATFANTGWQPWKVPTALSFWTGMPWAYRLPVFLAYIAFLISTSFWPRTKNLASLLALNSALVIGVQFWYADQGGLYVLWYLPLFILLLFRPNLEDRVAPELTPRNGLLQRVRQTLVRWIRKLFRLPEYTSTNP